MTAGTNNRAALDPRTVFMIVAAICLVSVVLWFMLHFKTRQEQLQDVNDQLDTTSTQLSDLQNKQAQLPALRRDVAKLQEDQKKFAKALPTTAKMGQVVAALRDSVIASGGTITSLITNPNSVPQNLPSGVQAIDISLNMNGRFTSIYQTLQTIETMGRFTKIKDVNITLPAANDTDPALAGVIDMTTYTFDPASVTSAAASAGVGAPGAAPAAAPAAGASATSGGKS